jgi:hypothetical protein
MPKMLFRFVGVLMSLAVAGAPVAADYCRAMCETAHVHGSAVASPHAGHHHQTSADRVRIDPAPRPCGQDHASIVGISAPDTIPLQVLVPAAIAVMPVSPMAPLDWASVFAINVSSSPPGTALHGLASPIRV